MNIFKKKTQPKFDLKDKATLTREEAKEVINGCLEDMSLVLQKHLGKGTYVSYINIVWEKTFPEENSPYINFKAVTTDTSDDFKHEEDKAKIITALASDNLVQIAVFQKMFNTFSQFFLTQDKPGTPTTDENFTVSITNGLEEVN